MGYRFNIFVRPIETNYSVDWESLLIELSLGLICAIMALAGWRSDMLLMAIPASIVSIICLGMFFYTIITVVVLRFRVKHHNSV